jgi:2-(1,2-epoxy-1,2-dihydrophenyl)acetyl-CoA isomerase
MAAIQTERTEDGSVATVTIDNPSRRNAVSIDDTEALAETLRSLSADEAVRCIVLTGAGDAFCAGLDLAAAAETSPSAALIDQGFHAAVRELMTCSKPIIARVDGPAIGAGAALAVACDLVYAAESATIGFSFARIGLSADTGATFTLPRLVGVQKATELLYTGERLPAEEAESLGLFTDVVPDDELDELIEERAGLLAEGPTKSFAALRRLLVRSNSNTLETQLELEAREQLRMFHTSDVVEGIAAFTEDREPDFSGS